MSLLRNISVVASILAATAVFAAGPDRKNAVSGQTIAELYAGKTWVWSKGGSYWGSDGKFQAVWKESVGIGKWYATTRGNLCYEAVWYYDDGGKVGEEPEKKCWRHVADSQGRLWKHDQKKNEWYRPKKEFAERVKPGNKIGRQVRKLRKRYGV